MDEVAAANEEGATVCTVRLKMKFFRNWLDVTLKTNIYKGHSHNIMP